MYSYVCLRMLSAYFVRHLWPTNTFCSPFSISQKHSMLKLQSICLRKLWIGTSSMVKVVRYWNEGHAQIRSPFEYVCLVHLYSCAIVSSRNCLDFTWKERMHFSKGHLNSYRVNDGLSQLMLGVVVYSLSVGRTADHSRY